MALEIRHNRAEHTHENEQFRRVATMLRSLFEQNSWDGLLIGNPFNEDFGRFRADAILLYNHGLIVIDLKDYRGTIVLPQNEETFKSSRWYTENPTDKGAVEIKGGANFINPFRQLQAYRGVMYEVVDQNIYLKGLIDPSKVLALNIFSGPVEIKNRVPGSVPYYKVTQESDLPTFLYDYSSINKYCSESAKALNAIFKAEAWQEHIDVPIPDHKEVERIRIAEDVETELADFLKQDSSGVLVLESMDVNTREDWLRFILSEAVEYNIPQTEAWCHSARIANKAGRRAGIALQGLYSCIYGGKKVKSEDVNETTEHTEDKDDHIQEVVPIRSDSSLDASAVVILYEAHLVTRSLHQSEILRFGTGRLLEDLLSFLQLDSSKRKLICIGDPYSLTYGKASESALSAETLCDIYEGPVLNYREPVSKELSTGKLELRKSIAKQINEDRFNSLSYPWLGQDLEKVDKGDVGKLLKDWFSAPCNSEPQYAALTYTNKNAKAINSWVKKECVKTGDRLSKNDLLILNNNINIPDDTGYGQPTKLFNGMYLLVEEVKGTLTKTITPKNKASVNLNFIEVSVRCLSLVNKNQANIWILDNYFSSEDGLSREELIAFRVFVNMALADLKKKNTFENSYFQKELNQSAEYNQAKDEVADLEARLKNKERVKTELGNSQNRLRKLKRGYVKKYEDGLFYELRESDPLINAAHVNFGWALTVHKAVGSSYGNTILNAGDGGDRGVKNLGYYRWLYSALTSTEQTAYVANPRTIHPLMDCKFVDECADALLSVSGEKKPLNFSGYVPEEKYRNQLPESLNENVIGTICEFAKIVEKDGFVLNDVRFSNKYLTKMHFERPESEGTQITLAISNKGAKDNWVVTSVRIEKVEGADKSTVNKYIDKLFEESASVGQHLPDDFRGDVYREIEEALKADNYSFALLDSSKDWQDIFEVKGTSSSARIRFWYDGKGFFTKAVLFEKTDDDVAAKISEVVSKWNQRAN